MIIDLLNTLYYEIPSFVSNNCTNPPKDSSQEEEENQALAPVNMSIKLNNGIEMPIVGFGLWKVNNDTCADQVYNAIKAGYRLFDGAVSSKAQRYKRCADDDSAVWNSLTYGQLYLSNPAIDYGNEVESGQGIARAIKDGLVKREELFIVSKLWNSFHEKHQVEKIARKQLKDWGIDYFDLYIIHFPLAIAYVDPSIRYPPGWEDADGNITEIKAPISDTWAAFEELVEKGLAKSIGVSNFHGQLLADLTRYAKIIPQTLQIEHHPYLTQPTLIKLAQKKGIAVTAYSSFGPQSFLELDMKEAQGAEPLLQHPLIKKIGDKHSKTPAQILLRWATQRDIAVIPKSNNPERLAQNLDVLSWDLEKSEIEEIGGLNKNLRFNDPVNVSCPMTVTCMELNKAILVRSRYIHVYRLSMGCKKSRIQGLLRTSPYACCFEEKHKKL